LHAKDQKKSLSVIQAWNTFVGILSFYPNWTKKKRRILIGFLDGAKFAFRSNKINKLIDNKKNFFSVLLQQIDGEAFLLLNQSDIVNILKIKLGPALKIYNTIPKF